MTVDELILKLMRESEKGRGDYLVGCEASDKDDPHNIYFEEYTKGVKADPADGKLVFIF